jgi:hypothetical protein
MPMLLKHIDAIAREKARDVVFVDFPACKTDLMADNEVADWSSYAARKAVVAWLDERGIKWEPCAWFANESLLTQPYDGRIYIDVPYDLLNETYQKLAAYLEKPDGTSRIAGATFYYLPLEMAMKNSHHDEPGYWENQAADW